MSNLEKTQFYDAVILGGGASGLMCAYRLGLKGFNVLVVEKNKKLGRKILISGGGKCNFTNKNLTSNNFTSTKKNFFKSALKEYTAKDFIELVEKNQIQFYEKTLGQLFCKNSAKEILEMLIDLCLCTNKVTFLKEQNIDNIKQVSKLKIADQNIYHIQLSNQYFTPNLIIATGGLSIPNIGASSIGYQIAKKFKLKIINTLPALVPFKSNESILEMTRELSGISIASKVSFKKKSFYENILFTHKGLSGPAILQISLYWDQESQIKINFLPEYTLKELLSKNRDKMISLNKFLKQYLPNKFVDKWLELLYIKNDTTISNLSHKSINILSEFIHNYSYIPIQTEGMRKAEVTKGGVCTSELNNKTMESNSNQGLYFIGEVVDVTGELGGFNFQWAWSSAYVCAKYMNKSMYDKIPYTDKTLIMDESYSQEQQSHQTSPHLINPKPQQPL
jgi:predicted Rossmann fold flavoprotein